MSFQDSNVTVGQNVNNSENFIIMSKVKPEILAHQRNKLASGEDRTDIQANHTHREK